MSIADNCIANRSMVEYAKQFLKTYYKWGGDDPSGMDCSGFIQEVLSSAGLDPSGDQTALALYKGLLSKTHEIKARIEEGDILFFGRDINEISHVAMAVNSWQMIEAGGGGAKTLTEQDAIKQNAFIRIRPISNRKDLVAILGLK